MTRCVACTLLGKLVVWQLGSLRVWGGTRSVPGVKCEILIYQVGIANSRNIITPTQLIHKCQNSNDAPELIPPPFGVPEAFVPAELTIIKAKHFSKSKHIEVIIEVALILLYSLRYLRFGVSALDYRCSGVGNRLVCGVSVPRHFLNDTNMLHITNKMYINTWTT